MQDGRRGLTRQSQSVVVDRACEVIAPGSGQSAQPKEISRWNARAQSGIARIDRFLVTIQLQERPHAIAVNLSVFRINLNGSVASVERLLKLPIEEEKAPSFGLIFRHLMAVGHSKLNRSIE